MIHVSLAASTVTLASEFGSCFRCVSVDTDCGAAVATSLLTRWSEMAVSSMSISTTSTSGTPLSTPGTHVSHLTSLVDSRIPIADLAGVDENYTTNDHVTLNNQYLAQYN